MGFGLLSLLNIEMSFKQACPGCSHHRNDQYKLSVKSMKIDQARFIRRISAVSNAIETIDNEMICFIIYCLNCIRHARNATYECGLISLRLQRLQVRLPHFLPA